MASTPTEESGLARLDGPPDSARKFVPDGVAEFYKKRAFVRKSFGGEDLGIGREEAQEARYKNESCLRLLRLLAAMI